ncbi:MAG: hypothetical protein F6K30_31140 [Cyanothece sp. SIO2G6]|nr:hypothetical protein [Cyanothece sp. SIO2G6]
MGNLHLEGEVLKNISITCLAMGDFEQATQLCRQALEIAETHNLSYLKEACQELQTEITSRTIMMTSAHSEVLDNIQISGGNISIGNINQNFNS